VEPYFASEVAHAAAGMSRKEANELVNRLLDKYERHLPDAPKGLPLHECMNLNSGEITPQFRAVYRGVREEMADQFGLKFTPWSLYL
jgi:hypothetical protein